MPEFKIRLPDGRTAGVEALDQREADSVQKRVDRGLSVYQTMWVSATAQDRAKYDRQERQNRVVMVIIVAVLIAVVALIVFAVGNGQELPVLEPVPSDNYPGPLGF